VLAILNHPGAKIADALDYAHRQRILHRDIKPSNIMITQNLDGTRDVKILDFGLAAEIRNSLSRVSRDLGDTTGTRPYMAPEQWSGMRQDASSDQYALAAVLYELLSGEVPFASAFESGDPVLMMNVVRTEAPEPLDDLPSNQNAIVLKALGKTRGERWDTCSHFIDALSSDWPMPEITAATDHLRGGHPVEIGSRQASPKQESPKVPRTRRRLKLWLYVIITLVVSIGMSWVVGAITYAVSRNNAGLPGVLAVTCWILTLIAAVIVRTGVWEAK